MSTISSHIPCFSLYDESKTLHAGGIIARAIALEGMIHLSGDLGAGKTTLCRGIIQAYGYTGPVKSPTFTLVEPYELAQGQIFHFDLYRLEDPEELEYLGFDDYRSQPCLCLVEWPEKASGMIGLPDVHVELRVLGKERSMQVFAYSQRGERVIESLERSL